MIEAVKLIQRVFRSYRNRLKYKEQFKLINICVSKIQRNWKKYKSNYELEGRIDHGKMREAAK